MYIFTVSFELYLKDHFNDIGTMMWFPHCEYVFQSIVSK